MAVTLSQLARELGVSPMTVSRALRGVGRIGQATRQRVLDAAERHGYRPHGLARAMRSGRSGCVALFMSTTPWRSFLPAALLQGIDEALAERGMYLAVARLPDEKLTADGLLPRLLNEWMADGMLVNYTHWVPPALREQLTAYRVPSIWINTRQPHDCVYPDDVHAGHEAARLLLAAGHRRIAYADHGDLPHEGPDLKHYSVIDRQRGYARAMTAAGREPLVVRADPRGHPVRRWLDLLAAPDRPTAVVCYNRRTAFSVINAAALAGLHLPAGLSVVSIDEEPVTEFEAPLATLLLPERQMGRRAVELLMEKIAHPDTPLPGEALRATVVPGGSVAECVER